MPFQLPYNPYEQPERKAVEAMPPVPSPEGGHLPNLIMKILHILAPQTYRTASRALGGEYKKAGLDTGKAVLADLLPDEPEMAPLDMMPGGEMLGAGAVKIGKFIDPKAFILRVSTSPRHDIGIIEKILKGPMAFRGKRTEMPASIITPGFLNQYLSEPGFLFNATKPSHLQSMYTTDVRSTVDDILPIKDYMAGIKASSKTYNRMRGLNDSYKQIDIPEHKREKYEEAYHKLRSIMGPPSLRRRKIWGDWERYRFDPFSENMDDFYKRQLENITHYRDLTDQEISPLHFNEVIYNYRGDPEQLAGVKINTKNYYPTGEQNEMVNEHQKMLIDFAKKHDLPIYDWPDVDSYVAAKRGLQNPYAGEWIKTPEGSYTSSEVDRLIKGLDQRWGRISDPDLPEAKLYTKKGTPIGTDYQKLLELMD
jgi:hypothetical protein